MEQRSPEWYATRCGKITASSFADLMATTKSGPAASRRNLIARLVSERLSGEVEDGYTNAAMQRGIELEPEARIAYEFHTGQRVEQVGFVDLPPVHPGVRLIGCSPDGLVGEDGLVEIKCPGSAAHVEYLRNGSHATDYRWQIQGQLWITGRAWCDIVSYHPKFPTCMQLAIRRVPRDEKAIAELEAACQAANAQIQADIDELKQITERKAA